MILNCICYGTLRCVEHPFIAITPRSTLTWIVTVWIVPVWILSMGQIELVSRVLHYTASDGDATVLEL